MNKEIKKALLSLLIILIIFFVLFKITKSIRDSVPSPLSSSTAINSDIIIAPNVDEPTVAGETKEYESVVLLNKAYIPSQDVYTNNYNKESIRLALNGEFDDAYFEVTGSVFGSGRHFLSFNFDSISGVLNAMRKSKNEIDLDQTKILGGVFVGGVPIQVKVSLLDNIVLSSTKEEFDSLGGKKTISLWSEMLKKPALNTPTIVPFLFAPFNEYGQYGGAKIEKIEFKFVCKQGSPCGAGVCENDKKYTECLKNLFGIEAAKSWCDRSREKGCDNL